jgi:site-specific DNA-methyltransferase (adenine-specific)
MARMERLPAQSTFPVQLRMNWILVRGLTRMQGMLDPFLGIENSAVAAQRCALREFIGFEVNEKYLAEAKRRVREAALSG